MFTTRPWSCAAAVVVGVLALAGCSRQESTDQAPAYQSPTLDVARQIGGEAAPSEGPASKPGGQK
jgi:hypothetical protein